MTMERMNGEVLGEDIFETSGEITIISPNGFHARPAAILVKAAKRFKSEINLVKDGKSANAKSLVAVMGFALEKGDTVEATAKGPDAREAIAAVVPIISGEMESADEAHGAARSTPVEDAKSAVNRSADKDGKRFGGIIASPGIAAGAAKRISRGEIEVSEAADGSPEDEERALRGAMDEAAAQLKRIEDETRGASGQEHAAIFAAHAELLEDPELMEYALKLISVGRGAACAWKSSYEAHAKRFKGLSSELFAARAADLEDVGMRVLRILMNMPDEAVYDDGCIVLATDLTPSDMAGMRGNVGGFCTVRGGATSHIAIMARSLELPALVGMDEAIMSIREGTMLLLDADSGSLFIGPGQDDIDRAKRRQAEMAARRELDVRDAMKPAVTTDGVRIDVGANIGGVSEAAGAAEFGCDGVGLLRSEFLFLDRDSPPGEDELAEAYVAIARAIGRDKPLVVRTMDIGGDKHVPYIKQDAEDNPFLGVRGLRLSRRTEDLFAAQIRAILRAAEFCDLHIMFPMVSTVEEFREARALVEKLRGGVGAPGVKIGLMSEVPSSAVLARHFAAEADFMSIGTNDLTQYTMAADRGNPNLADIADGLNPAVLAMIKSVVDGARGRDCWVGVCGGLAGDSLAVPVLIGLGVEELSVSVPAIPQIKSRVRSLSKSRCEEIASRALELATTAEVRDYLSSV
jgi:phosphoenolpyruvate-protein phosphotransferase